MSKTTECFKCPSRVTDKVTDVLYRLMPVEGGSNARKKCDDNFPTMASLFKKARTRFDKLKNHDCQCQYFLP